jgi:hypothetical protein
MRAVLRLASSARGPGCSRSPGWHSRAAQGAPVGASHPETRHPESSGGQRIPRIEDVGDRGTGRSFCLRADQEESARRPVCRRNGSSWAECCGERRIGARGLDQDGERLRLRRRGGRAALTRLVDRSTGRYPRLRAANPRPGRVSMPVEKAAVRLVISYLIHRPPVLDACVSRLRKPVGRPGDRHPPRRMLPEQGSPKAEERSCERPRRSRLGAC